MTRGLVRVEQACSARCGWQQAGTYTSATRSNRHRRDECPRCGADARDVTGRRRGSA